jgi:hypothetical protein
MLTFIFGSDDDKEIYISLTRRMANMIMTCPMENITATPIFSFKVMRRPTSILIGNTMSNMSVRISRPVVNAIKRIPLAAGQEAGSD